MSFSCMQMYSYIFHLLYDPSYYPALTLKSKNQINLSLCAEIGTVDCNKSSNQETNRHSFCFCTQGCYEPRVLSFSWEREGPWGLIAPLHRCALTFFVLPWLAGKGPFFKIHCSYEICQWLLIFHDRDNSFFPKCQLSETIIDQSQCQSFENHQFNVNVNTS